MTLLEEIEEIENDYATGKIDTIEFEMMIEAVTKELKELLI